MLKVFEMFAGYGGSSFALKKVGIEFECVGYSEIDKYAIQCYNQNFPNVKNFGDCTKIDPNEIPSFDLLTGGFPCQDVSLAGKRDLSKGRTNLYSEILRIAEFKKPKYMVLENVKGLLSAGEDGRLINIIISDLKKIGYSVVWKLLNSKKYGIPQNRERVVIVCFRSDIYVPLQFQFPQEEELKIFIKDILEQEVDKKYYLKDEQVNKLLEGIEKKSAFKERILQDKSICGSLMSIDYKEPKVINIVIDSRKYQGETEPRISELSPTLMARARSDESPIIFALRGRNPENTSDRTIGIDTEQRPEFKTDGCSNTISTIQKDNLLFIDVYNNSIPKDQNVSTALRTNWSNGNMQVMNCITEAQGRQGSSKEFLSTCEKVSVAVLDLYNHKAITDGTSITLTEPHHNNLRLYNQGMFRRLTPKECFRLMGFLNDEINLDGLSDTQKYKLAGNGWDINLFSKVFKQMFKNEVSYES